MIHLDAETFLECFPEGAALIGPQKNILRLNSRLAESIGMIKEGPCYEALAGLHEPCPFCPLEKLFAGEVEPVFDARREMRGKTCAVSLRLIRDEVDGDCVLETIQVLGPGARSRVETERPPSPGTNAIDACRLLLRIPEEPVAGESFDRLMTQIVESLQTALPGDGDVKLRMELDDRIYGDPPGDGDLSRVLEADIVVSDGPGGRLIATVPESYEHRRETVDFLRAAADITARQLDLSREFHALSNSERRYKKLAGNLAKEMWSRTEALAKETSYLEGILKSSDDMIITTDLESRIVEFNPGAEKILGFDADEVHGRPIGDLWEHAEERERIMAQVRTGSGIRNYVTRLRTKSGELRDISLTLSVLRDGEGVTHGTIGISKDITTEKAIIEELERLNRNYRETIHFISHESKNALIVIGGFVKRLLKTETDPDKQEQLRMVYHHSKFLEAMSKDFLVMAELDHGELRPRKKLITDFYEEVIYPAMLGLKERYPDSFDTYDTSMGGVGAVKLHGDAGLLEIVYRNLFGNALKYRGPNGNISFGVAEQPESYVFNVWNQGPGVPPDQVEKIFEKFYRGDDENTRNKKGTGLGLYNIRRIVEAHGGRVWCETRPGEWVNFLFLLPKE
jgi:PAS domain S-box-containing protein